MLHLQRVRLLTVLALVVSAIILAQNLPLFGPAISSPLSNGTALQKVKQTYGRLPLAFEPNLGQINSQALYLSRGSGYSLFLAEDAAVIGLKKAGTDGQSRANLVRMKWLGSNPTARVSAQEELPGKSNYFKGNLPSQWHTDVPTYARVEYRELYPGIDLAFYGNQRQLEYDFLVDPGADPASIRLSFDGVDKLELNARGELLLHTSEGVLLQHAPEIYQTKDGQKIMVKGGYHLVNSESGETEVDFSVENYERSLPLVIDPVLAYSTYLGGTGDDQGKAIAVDSGGNAYITGYTFSANFPNNNALYPDYDATYPLGDAFVTKLNAAGSAVVYSTYLGGDNADIGNGIAVDSSGNAYIAGYTSSINFPVTNNAYSTTGFGNKDIFVTKLNAAGNGLVYSTFIGSSKDDVPNAIALDSSGNAYITGYTTSEGYPTTPGAFSTGIGSLNIKDAFVTKLSADGSSLLYSTFLGGSAEDIANGIAVDSSGSAYITGQTASVDFPVTPGAFGTSQSGGAEVFVTKLNATGTSLIYSGELSGANGDFGDAIALDANNNAYVAGHTFSTNFPTTSNAYQTTSHGGGDGFVAKINPAGSALIYSTYVGGSSDDQVLAIGVTNLGEAVITGQTSSSDFPVTPGYLYDSFGGIPFDAYVLKLNPAGSSLVNATFLGGNDADVGSGLALDSAGNAYITGYTKSANFPVTNGALDTTYNSGYDAFVAKINRETDLAITKTVDNPTPQIGDLVKYTVTVSNNGPAAATNVKITDQPPSGLTAVKATVTMGTYDPASGLWTIASLPAGQSAVLTLEATIGQAGSLTNTATLTALDQFDTNPNNNTAQVTLSITSADVSVQKSVDISAPALNQNVTFTIKINNAGPDAATNIKVTDKLPAGLQLVSATPLQGSYDSASGVWSAGNLAKNGATLTLKLVATPVQAGNITNTASKTGQGEFDPDASNNSASVTLTVATADIKIQKSMLGTPAANRNIQFTVSATNNGPGSASGVQVLDKLPAGLQYVSSTDSQGAYDPATGYWNVGNLTLGQTATLNVTATVTAPGQITNTAIKSAENEIDPDSNNDSASVSLNVGSTDVLVQKGVNNSSPKTGDSITYTVTLINLGSIPATNIVVSEALPEGLSADTNYATPSMGSYDQSKGTWTIPKLDSGVFASLTLTGVVVRPGAFSNTAAKTSQDQFDPNAGNDSSQVNFTVAGQDWLVNRSVDDGQGDQPGSFSYAVTRAPAGNRVIFASSINTVTLAAGTTLQANSGITIQGQCGLTGSPAVSIVNAQANSGSLTLNGNVTIDGVSFSGLPLKLRATNGANHLICVKAGK
ncbi:MAG TPA: SBBP repeat-containing protein [Chloroflexia bacterium]|nr:SBBP repeat-containing protein [Chloroflexia bacterium]